MHITYLILSLTILLGDYLILLVKMLQKIFENFICIFVVILSFILFRTSFINA